MTFFLAVIYPKTLNVIAEIVELLIKDVKTA